MTSIATYVLSFVICVAHISWGQASQPSSEESKAQRDARLHSQLWHTFSSYGIMQQLSETTGNITVINNEDEQDNDMVHDIRPPYPPLRLVEFSCLSDAVVVATAVHGISHMTADGKFTYSDWDIQYQGSPAGQSESTRGQYARCSQRGRNTQDQRADGNREGEELPRISAWFGLLAVSHPHSTDRCLPSERRKSVQSVA